MKKHKNKNSYNSLETFPTDHDDYLEKSCFCPKVHLKIDTLKFYARQQPPSTSSLFVHLCGPGGLKTQQKVVWMVPRPSPLIRKTFQKNDFFHKKSTQKSIFNFLHRKKNHFSGIVPKQRYKIFSNSILRNGNGQNDSLLVSEPHMTR